MTEMEQPKLRNIHRHLGMEEHGCDEAVISGDYDYYHFGQDREKDHVRPPPPP